MLCQLKQSSSGDKYSSGDADKDRDWRPVSTQSVSTQSVSTQSAHSQHTVSTQSVSTQSVSTQSAVSSQHTVSTVSSQHTVSTVSSQHTVSSMQSAAVSLVRYAVSQLAAVSPVIGLYAGLLLDLASVALSAAFLLVLPLPNHQAYGTPAVVRSQ